jgi:hypothetical protein
MVVGLLIALFLAGRTAAQDQELITAVWAGDANKVKALIAAGADVNIKGLIINFYLHFTFTLLIIGSKYVLFAESKSFLGALNTNIPPYFSPQICTVLVV